MKAKSYYTGEEEEFEPYATPMPIRRGVDVGSSRTDQPRSHVPQPTVFEPGEQVADISAIGRQFTDGRYCFHLGGSQAGKFGSNNGFIWVM